MMRLNRETGGFRLKEYEVAILQLPKSTEEWRASNAEDLLPFVAAAFRRIRIAEKILPELTSRHTEVLSEFLDDLEEFLPSITEEAEQYLSDQSQSDPTL
ncbi:MAG: hypothetical protein JWL85_517 [Candidatus Saccharibacteria bacterium]|nr:hypothetical protein [Candidatus Saccharibacteria bacterium]